jgi:hypothetical protein
MVRSSGPGAVRICSICDGSALRRDGRGIEGRLLVRKFAPEERSSSLWWREYEGGGPEGALLTDLKLGAAVSAIDVEAMVCILLGRSSKV